MIMLSKKNFNKICLEVRKNIIELIYNAGSGHLGSSLSIVELMVYLYFVQINFNNKHRDKIILSKGHAAPCLYGVAMEKKILEKNFKYLRKIGSKLQGHPDRKFFNHIDLGTGALGQGLSVAIGYGIASYLQKKKFNAYCILGDGELQEGQIWEAAMYIGSKKILNVCTIIDNNKFQNEMTVKETLDLGNLQKKFESFGFKVVKINGHRFSEISKILTKFKKKFYSKPLCIILNTVKGKGIKFMENEGEWHAKTLSKENYIAAKKLLK